MKPAQLSSKLKGLPGFLATALNRSLQSLAEDIVDMNVSQMEEYGQDSRGVEFGDYSDASYEMGYPQMKAAMGREGRFINLHNEGSFHEGMDVRISGGGIDIYSRDPKTDKLIKRYGVDIFGLNDEHMDQLTDELVIYLRDELATYFV